MSLGVNDSREFHDHLQTVRKATDRILMLDDLVVGGMPTNHVTLYKADPGTVVGECLHHTPACAVMRVVCTAGSCIPCYTHGEVEWTLIVSGKAVYDGKEYGKGQGFCTLPTEQHEVSFPEDTILIRATIPANQAYPRSR